MIEAKDVTMKFRMADDVSRSLKDYFVKKLKGELTFNEFVALQDVSFHIEPGEVIGIVGNNGAGKSTLLKIISGILTPTSGTLEVHGNIAPMLELGAGFDMELTGSENIFLNGAILGYSKDFLQEQYSNIVEFAELEEFIHVPLRNYSSGMIMRLAFAIATLVNPDILVLDEILAVGDAQFQKKSQARMLELMSGGTTVLLVSHNIGQILNLCTRAMWLEKGQLMAMGETEEVCRAYLKSTGVVFDDEV